MRQLTVEEAADFLNQLAEIDPEAIHHLVESRVPCSRELADHPTVEIAEIGGLTSVGILGILNGMFNDGTNKRLFASTLNGEIKFSVKEWGEWKQEIPDVVYPEL